MIVASRYAKSLIDLATEKNQLDAVYADMNFVKSVCSSSKDFLLFLNSPIIKTDKKIDTIKSIFDSKVSAITIAFLSIIATKRRESVIPEIAESFIAQYKEQKNILTAVVVSANGLDAATKQQALNLVKTQMNAEVELIEKTNPDIIGGFILKVGDKQVDKSVSRQLFNLKKELTSKALN